MTRISCQNQLILDTWRANLATNRRFSRLRPLRERMGWRNCQGSPPGNAPRRYLAAVGRWGTHFASILPSASVWERTTAISCRNCPTSRMLLSDILPRRPSAAQACSSGRREHAGKNGLQRGRRQSRQPAVRRCNRVPHPRDLACGRKQILQRNCGRRHGVGRLRANETPTNSTTRADASKKP